MGKKSEDFNGRPGIVAVSSTTTAVKDGYPVFLVSMPLDPGTLIAKDSVEACNSLPTLKDPMHRHAPEWVMSNRWLPLVVIGTGVVTETGT